MTITTYGAPANKSFHSACYQLAIPFHLNTTAIAKTRGLKKEGIKVGPIQISSVALDDAAARIAKRRESARLNPDVRFPIRGHNPEPGKSRRKRNRDLMTENRLQRRVLS